LIKENGMRLETLQAFCEAAMMRAGMAMADARIVAEVLVTTDSWGTHTHGTKQLRNLLKNFREGKMDLNATTTLVEEGPAWAVFDGHCSMPILSGLLAMRTALAKAKGSSQVRGAGIGFATVRNSGHYGAAGFYADLAAREDCIGISICNVDPGVSAPGSRGPVLGTNPIAWAAPDGMGHSVFLDIATSVVAAGKIYRAQAEGTPIKEGWLIDGDGLPTTDPSGYPLAGALMPMAGHKGFGLALLVEILTGVISGGAFGSGVTSWVIGPKPVNQSLSFVAIDIAAFMPVEVFYERMATLMREIREAPKALGSQHIYLPGDMEWERRETALREGLLLPEDVMASLRGLGDDYGLALDSWFTPEGGEPDKGERR
jgi:ureidoglycolate dehydrogenase (NAD+)